MPMTYEMRCKRCTPSSINPNLCLARTWGDGLGGQCKNVPNPCSQFCEGHIYEGFRRFGHVDDIIPVSATSEVTVFPNPAQGVVRARLEGFDSEVEWVLRNAMAKELQSGIFRPSNGLLLNFDMSDYAVGMYSLEVYDRKSRVINWIIRE